ncbi:hypothetical protein KXR83_08575 [Williamsia muralis]|uniref:hypothetical protein n=1 Tax=Williamsia marianensis TaxID=85044 RepID=UPI000DE66F49|nr:hypothetical protein [Williamsia marianensis]PVY33010.1 hypothetical protein C7458_102768 [Williamsia marianensis]
MTAPTPARPLAQLGPGTLTFEAPGGGAVSLDMSAQVTKCTIAAKGDSEDPTPVLSGGVVVGARTYAWTLNGELFQDVAKDGVIDWSWRNAGAETNFTFTPTSGGEKVSGRVQIDPIDLGGDVKKKNTSEIEWAIVGTPAFAPAGGGTAGTTPAV